MSLKDLKVSLAGLILSESTNIPKMVEDHFKNQEIDRRAKIGIKAVEAYDIAVKNLTKADKPDVVTFTVIDGVKTKVEQYSQKQIETINKAKSAVDKIESLWNNAIGEKADWKALEDYLKNPPKDSE